ncbi:MAG: TIGR04219 family outer membrane beta-barrel protein [Proteobacteria bacterium]|nr:TIGR04219 family outer membrane beta-barrel protein [Pseudomonadota bacterium]MBU1714302.1 TIGR04219 family outer membrane beta-barrel protein [Pseudomonadota bacterium]
MKSKFVMAVFLLLLAVPSLSYGFIGFEVAVGVWHQGPGGTISYEPVKAIDEIDLENNLGYDAQSRIMGRAKVELPLILPDIYLVATPMEFDGLGRKDVDFKFGDQTFTAGTGFYSKVSLDQYDMAFAWSIPLLKTVTLKTANVDFGLNVRMFQLSAEIAQGAVSETTGDVTAFLPMLYVAAQLQPLDWLGIEAEVRGGVINKSHCYDYIARIKYYPVDLVFVAGGWHYQDLKIDEEDVEASLTFSGPFIEAGIDF